MTIFYCVEKANEKAISAGCLPNVWGQISGMADLSEETLADLTWAGYPDHAFLTRAAAVIAGINEETLDASLVAGTAVQSDHIRKLRDEKLSTSDWVVTKAFETSVAIPANWVIYRQALRDIPLQVGFPFKIEWPESP